MEAKWFFIDFSVDQPLNTRFFVCQSDQLNSELTIQSGIVGYNDSNIIYHDCLDEVRILNEEYPLQNRSVLYQSLLCLKFLQGKDEFLIDEQTLRFMTGFSDKYANFSDLKNKVINKTLQDLKSVNVLCKLYSYPKHNKKYLLFQFQN